MFFRFFIFFAKFRPRPGDLGLGYRVPNKLATTAAKITEIRQRTKEPTHPSSHLMAAERTGDLSNKNRNNEKPRATLR